MKFSKFAFAIFLFFLVGFASARAVGVYHLDDGSGTTCKDSSYFGLTGTLHNATWNSTGWKGGALNFNGSWSYVDLGNPEALNMTASPLTIMAWINLRELNAAESYLIIGKYNTYALYVHGPTSAIRFVVVNASDSETRAYTITSGNLNSWIHVTGVATGTQVLLYINGSLVESNAHNILPWTQSIAKKVLIGGDDDGGTSWFNGTIDEVRIYNTSLSATEIADIFNCSQFVNGTLIAKNESSTNTQIPYNVVISNSTKTVTLENVWNTGEYCPAAVLNSLTVAVSNNNFYSPRYYYPVFTNGMNQNVTAYLLPFEYDYAIFMTFYVSGNGNAIQNALVTVQKDIGGNWTTIGQRHTDSVGGASFYLDSATQYTVITNASGYSTRYDILSPSSNTYFISLSSNASSGFQSMFSDVNYTVSPSENYVYNSTTNNTFTFAISSKNGTLNNYGMNITNASGTLLFTQTNTDSVFGGTITASINCSQYNGYLNLTIFFDDWNYSATTYMFTKQYQIYGERNASYTSLYDIVKPGGSMAQSGISDFTKSLIALLISLMVTGAFSKFGDKGLGGFIFVGILALCTIGNWLHNPLLILGEIFLAVALYVAVRM